MTCNYPPILITLPNRIYLRRTEFFFPPPHSSTEIVITNHQLPTPTYLVSSNPTITLRHIPGRNVF